VNDPVRVVLVGLMGSGKTSVGKALAAKLSGTLLDTDQIVEADTGMTVGEIFAAEGEEAFRRRELVALRRALEHQPPSVIATGGGIVTSEEARRILRELSEVVFLDVSPEVAASRVGDASTRPLLAGDALGTLRDLERSRRGLYEEVADIVIDADRRNAGAVASEILDALEVAA